jgi:hypothetical protein
MNQHGSGSQESIDPFLGTWQLDPSQSQYEFGQPPQSGLYRIEPEGTSLKFTAEWVTADGQPGQVVYYAIPDGQDHPSGHPTVADTIATTQVSARQMDTVSKKDGRIVAVANRVLSPDGRTMTVTQSGTTPQGQPYRDVAIYQEL